MGHYFLLCSLLSPQQLEECLMQSRGSNYFELDRKELGDNVINSILNIQNDMGKTRETEDCGLRLCQRGEICTGPPWGDSYLADAQ